MAKHGSGPAEPQKDQDGLVVQKYTSTVLVVVPGRDYGEQTLRHARSSLHNVHVGTWSVSSNFKDLIKGRLQDEFLVDGDIAEARMENYSESSSWAARARSTSRTTSTRSASRARRTEPTR
jgi:hypothetical protein